MRGALSAERGLSLSQEKIRVTTIDDGFSFLGFKARKFRDRKLLIRPDKAKVLAHLREIKTYLDANKQAPAGDVVHELTLIIRGWSTYYRHACSTDAFSYADHRIWRMLWQWAKRRHPNKSKGWVKARYFRRAKTRVWNFADAGVPGASPATSLICRRLPRASITSIPVQSAADWSILGVSEHEKNASLGSGVSDNTADHFTGERPVSRVRPNPEAYRNIQVNFCKRPGCPHFCVEPLVGCIGPGRRSGSDGYRLVGARAESALRCSYCGVESRIKSNRAIHQEFRRQAAALFAPSPLICPTEGCLSDPRHPTKAFQKFGKSTAGALRFRCRSCKATFSVPGPTARQRRTRANAPVFRHLVNKVPLNPYRRVMRGVVPDALRQDPIHPPPVLAVCRLPRNLPDGDGSRPPLPEHGPPGLHRELGQPKQPQDHSTHRRRHGRPGVRVRVCLQPELRRLARPGPSRGRLACGGRCRQAAANARHGAALDQGRLRALSGAGGWQTAACARRAQGRPGRGRDRAARRPRRGGADG